MERLIEKKRMSEILAEGQRYQIEACEESEALTFGELASVELRLFCFHHIDIFKFSFWRAEIKTISQIWSKDMRTCVRGLRNQPSAILKCFSTVSIWNPPQSKRSELTAPRNYVFCLIILCRQLMRPINRKKEKVVNFGEYVEIFRDPVVLAAIEVRAFCFVEWLRNLTGENPSTKSCWWVDVFREAWAIKLWFSAAESVSSRERNRRKSQAPLPSLNLINKLFDTFSNAGQGISGLLASSQNNFL